MSVFQYQHFYHNEKTGQAFGVVCKGDTAIWGKCMVIEALHWDGQANLLPVPLEMEARDYHEVSKERFLELKAAHEKDEVARQTLYRERASKKWRWFSWLKRKKVEPVHLRSQSPVPLMTVLKGGKDDLCAGE